MKKITLEEYVTASGTYQERMNDPELTDEVKSNIGVLLDRVELLLTELKIPSIKISSGFRPLAVNKSTKNAAKKSYHEIGMAIDILDDKKQSLAALILSRPELLKKYNLWIEDPAHTIGEHTNWVHLDTGTRSDRPIRKFIP